MKKQVGKTFRVLVIAFSAAMLITSFMESCKKTYTNVFDGTYYGSLSGPGGTNPDTLVITSGNSSSALNIASHTGGAIGSFTINGTATGDSLLVSPQNITINGGLTVAISGAAALNGSNLTAYWTEGTVNINLSYSGTKH